MGIQIYIKKQALVERGIKHEVVEFGDGDLTDEEQLVRVEGLMSGHQPDMPLLMDDFGDSIMHDANHWGSSRQPIIDFINKHKLLAGTDWFEA